MTEDDTFIALKRISFEQLAKEGDASPMMLMADRDVWFAVRGWTRCEYINEHNRRMSINEES